MADRLTSAEFARRHELPDWRILLQGLETWFAAPTFSEGAAFAGEVAAAADAANHHPDLEVRYPGRVHVRLMSHDAGGLTDRDAGLATTISELAAARGIPAEPRASTRLEVAIDAMDIAGVIPFWRAALGYVDGHAENPGGDLRELRDPSGIGPVFWFQQMDEPRPQRNRIHLDITVPPDEVDARVEAALAAGGTMVNDSYARAFWVLADAEGNEACLCTWEDR